MGDNSSVKVAVRLRPLVKSEIEKGCKNILEVYKDVSQIHVKDSEKAFTYNYVLDTDASQIDLYNSCVKDIIPNLFEGYNLTILAYGQTGSGKTYSMGTTYTGNEDMGVIPRSVKQIFEIVKDNFTFDFTITVSFMELYQEILYDLLSEKPREQCMLEIREDPNKGIHIPGLTEIPVETTNDIFNCLIRGSSGRATACTNMNAQSSRSHAIFTLTIAMQAKHNSEENKTAKFHLVDLAGSERPKKTGAVGTTFKEGVNINKGLLVLGNVISLLGEEKQENRFIPYRDSNLTRLLKDSLGGNSITLMIACVSPADYNIDETLSTLRYADRARKIKNKPIVNQDPQVAQINELKKTVKMLQLQILGQGGPTVSLEKIRLLEQEVADIRAKNRDLTHKLSSALNDKASFLEKLLHLQTCNEMLSKKIFDLKENYDITLNNITIALESGDADTLKDCKTKFEEMKHQFEDLNAETKKAEVDMNEQEAEFTSLMDANNHCNETQAKEINDIQEHYATRQIELNNELKELMKKLAMKEFLAKELERNTQNMVDYNNIRENELRIEALEKEKNELMQQLKNVQHNVPSKIAEERRKRVKELENQIHELTRKLNEQNKLIRLKEKDEHKIKQLNHEILLMKQNRVKLVKSMKEESEKFRTWKLQRERELAKLRQEDVKKKNQIQKMQTMHLKQQNVLKRKVEEAVAANKRLKDALATRKIAQELKSSGLERFTNWLKHEVEVALGFTEIEMTLAGLLEDRALLQKQLDNLQSSSNPDLAEIKNLEYDIELRSVQIQDMQQKLLDADDDAKSRINLDNIQTMAEAKQGMRVLIDLAMELKKKECSLTMKSIELENTPSENHPEKKVYDEKLKELEKEYSSSLNNLEQEYQEKIAILLGQLRGVELKANNSETDSFSKIIKMQTEQLEIQGKKIEELNKILEQKEKEREVIPQLKLSDVKEETPPKKIKLLDGTFVVDGKENFDTPHVEEDNILKDPDWVKTPIGRRVMVEKKNIVQTMRQTMKSKLSFEDDQKTEKPGKRSSDGGCACTTNCQSNRCGCRKTGLSCRGNCKCNTLACTNRTEETIEQISDKRTFKKPRVKV
ncbi:chromosome-associated kinesin KIF4 isoform X2 [Coccinella septempunctata]|uniref:chromosome-associated kinesin KIF4 isoform X2 n=1 Tax=Coccinella septempunctata TaxID=41139 RepID=UPI001D077964|nr:chromosome-associated kinesin KIF4 isoform X2 [Coccinella septempunctata]